MAVLTRDEIIKRINDGEVKIEPFNEKLIGPASIDLTLDNQFRVFKNVRDIIHLTSENFDIDKVSEVVTVNTYYTLMPGATVHGITVEKITLPQNLCGWIEGRSRFARLGLMIHVTAGFIQPGVSNKQVLEMNNSGPMPIAIHPGIAICQIVLEETIGRATYKGIYKDQIKP